MAKIICWWKLLGIFGYILQGILLAVFIYPFSAKDKQLQQKKAWAKRVLRWLSVEVLPCDGLVQEINKSVVNNNQGVFIACNHISWLDIVVLNSIEPMAFVAKSEVRNWPVIGWLTSKNDTLFIKRSTRKSLLSTSEQVIDLLQKKQVVTIFPEGTTTAGGKVLPFHSSLFGVVCNQNLKYSENREVLPLAISYHDNIIDLSKHSQVPVYIDDMNLIQSMRQIANAKKLYVKIQFSSPISVNQRTRREVSNECELVIGNLLALPN